MADRRVRKTQAAIKTALITLLKTKEFEQITIQHIADEADINRATFYQHYLDKYDLLDKIEDEVLLRLQQNFQSYAENILTTLKEEREAHLVALYKGILEIISADIVRYQVLLNIHRNGEMEQKIGQTISGNLRSIFPEAETINGVPFRYFHAYIVGSMFAVIKTWILDEARPSVDEQAQYIFQLLYQGPWQNILNESQEGAGQKSI
ncbi:TetR/AcrR family transcriptional regulator [Staphylococcus ratti]|uniref:TetR/AcrR family transcriptional regulator C-terminal domain-containing protein n=1 Tax=Staphylococcus ratti TaxID=2892440 RepID=A0ABY3PCM1_9STAP|nr:TetR/AcrR family transcriptional regulator C-terminal domain-containing protein [Staphylococcus ratti]UEX89999.1 TetR/AcrR family transcriptional regulator C-terminal domain-containing protein [Staphylococcus ratti]